VADATGDEAVLIFAREPAPIRRAGRVDCTVGVAFYGDGGTVMGGSAASLLSRSSYSTRRGVADIQKAGVDLLEGPEGCVSTRLDPWHG
jgi:hypothetical protein